MSPTMMKSPVPACGPGSRHPGLDSPQKRPVRARIPFDSKEVQVELGDCVVVRVGLAIGRQPTVVLPHLQKGLEQALAARRLIARQQAGKKDRVGPVPRIPLVLALEGVELDDTELRRGQLLEQINETIKTSPEEAANLVRRWAKAEG